MTRRRWIIAGVAGALVLSAYLVGYFMTGSRLPASTTIAGVEVGGLSPAAAERALASGTEDRTKKPIVTSLGGQEFEVDPAKAGLKLDVAASVAAAGGTRSWDPRDMFALLFGGHDEAPVVTVDEKAMSAAVATLAETVDKPVVEAEITFETKPAVKAVARKPVAGNEVPQQKFADRIQTAWLMTDRTLPIPVERVQPSVDQAGLDQAMTQIAEPAISAPVALQVGGKTLELPVTAYAPALAVVAANGKMVAKIDAKDLAGPLTSSTTGIGSKAVDASFKFENGTPVIVPGKAGVGLDPASMAVKLIPVLTKSAPERSITINATSVEPAFTTADAQALGIKEKIGGFTTKFPYAEYRNINQSEAARRINGTILKPGETFSFNKIVGERTAANGFVSGFVINGGVFREELGGGVSQVATTAYNAGFFSGLVDVEHHPHAFYIDRYPVGREATVYYGHLDLRFKNQYDNGLVIRAWVDKATPGTSGRMNVEIYGTKVYTIKARTGPRYNFRSPGTRYDSTAACVPQGPVVGFDVDFYRDFYQNGKKIRTEKYTANYQAADRVICAKKP